MEAFGVKFDWVDCLFTIVLSTLMVIFLYVTFAIFLGV